MCGIAGYFAKDHQYELDVEQHLLASLHHRGPDSHGSKKWETTHGELLFLHTRLSIIDLSELGLQPMASHDEKFYITFNGEVYNFAEIKKDLVQLGIPFKSSSDTEVIINAYALWGAKCVERFIGMFAIAIYDVEKEELVLIRDRAGVKPLYYFQDDINFVFGSELKLFPHHPGFSKRLSAKGTALYFQYGYIPAPFTIFENTFKVEPGQIVRYNIRSRKLTKEKYWDVYDFYNKPSLNLSMEDATVELERIFKSAFNYRMVADVPVGIFLSGGYDSSIVTAILARESTNKLKTYTIGFHEDAWNEAEYAKKVANYLGTEHSESYCSVADGQAVIRILPDIIDEPLADQSVIPTYLVSKMARQHVTVALSADGGDETFAGYNRYFTILKRWQELQKYRIVPAGLIRAAQDLGFDSNAMTLMETVAIQKNIQAYATSVQQGFNAKEIKQLLNTQENLRGTAFDSSTYLNSNDDLNKLMALEYKTYMVDNCLAKVDRASMHVSLEAREPLLDHRIVEFAAQLPSSLKAKDNVQKALLKNLTHKYLPEEMMNRPKMGFSIPVLPWLKNELKDLLDHYTDEGNIRREGILNPEMVSGIKAKFLQGNDNKVNKQIWHLLVFRMWTEKWIGR